MVTITAAINATIMPYSTAVAPASLSKCRRMRSYIFVSIGCLLRLDKNPWAAPCRAPPLYHGLGAPRSLQRPYKRYPPGDAGHIDRGAHFAVDETTYVWGPGYGACRQGSYGSGVPYPRYSLEPVVAPLMC